MIFCNTILSLLFLSPLLVGIYTDINSTINSNLFYEITAIYTQKGI